MHVDFIGIKVIQKSSAKKDKIFTNRICFILDTSWWDSQYLLLENHSCLGICSSPNIKISVYNFLAKLHIASGRWLPAYTKTENSQKHSWPWDVDPCISEFGFTCSWSMDSQICILEINVTSDLKIHLKRHPKGHLSP